MSARRIVTQGGGNNLYKVSEYDNWYYVYEAGRGFFSTGTLDIGKTRSFKDALDIIRAYTGKEIKEISEW